MSVKKRIGLVMQGGPDWIGGTHYIENLACTLSTSSSEPDAPFVCLLSVGNLDLEHVRNEVDAVYVAETPKRLLARAKRRLVHRLTYRDTTLGDLLARANVDFVYPYFRGRWLHERAASAAWIADFQHVRMPEMFRPAERTHRTRHFRRILDHAAHVVVSSESAERDLHDAFGNVRPRVHVLRFHTFPEESWFELEGRDVLRKYELPDRYFVICNQFWRHKNHETAFAAVRLLAERGTRVHVVCTGRVNDYRDPGYAEELVSRMRSWGADHVHVLGVIPRADQVQLIRHAIAVIQPSLFEGWSTVVEDARVFGKRIVLSDIDVHVEQAPDRGAYFPARDAEALAQRLAEWWDSEVDTPDIEQCAKRDALARTRAFGETFLRIADAACRH